VVLDPQIMAELNRLQLRDELAKLQNDIEQAMALGPLVTKWLAESKFTPTQLRGFLSLCLAAPPDAWVTYLRGQLEKPKSVWSEKARTQTEGFATKLDNWPQSFWSDHTLAAIRADYNDCPDPDEVALELLRDLLDRRVRSVLRKRG
jgi:hypothetical protein